MVQRLWCDYNHLRCQREVVSTVTTVDTDSGNFTELTSDDLDAFPSAFVSAIELQMQMAR